jgi:hypothetical protein
MEDTEVLLSIGPSPMRRIFAVVCFVVLAFVLFGLLLQGDPSFLWQVFFAGAAVLSLLGAKRFYTGTGDAVELTKTELRLKSGRVLTTVENIKVVERGPFAFKPSNGFLVRLKEPCGSGWAPGLFWQRGKYLGIGGAINAGHTRAMAESITALKMDYLPSDEGLF